MGKKKEKHCYICEGPSREIDELGKFDICDECYSNKDKMITYTEAKKRYKVDDIPDEYPHKPYHTIAYGKSVHGRLYSVADMEIMFEEKHGMSYEEFKKREATKAVERDAKRLAKKVSRKKSLQSRLKKAGFVFDEENTEHVSYVNKGQPTIKSIIGEAIKQRRHKERMVIVKGELDKRGVKMINEKSCPMLMTFLTEDDKVKPSIEQVVKCIEKEHKRREEQRRKEVDARNSKKKRRKLLSDRLGEYGLEMRSDSKVCKAYIEMNKIGLDTVVDIMREMDFFYSYTHYTDLIEHYKMLDRSMCGYYDIDNCIMMAKIEAIARYKKKNRNNADRMSLIPESLREGYKERDLCI